MADLYTKYTERRHEGHKDETEYFEALKKAGDVNFAGLIGNSILVDHSTINCIRNRSSESVKESVGLAKTYRLLRALRIYTSPT